MNIYKSKLEFNQCYTIKEVSKESLEFLDCMIVASKILFEKDGSEKKFLQFLFYLLYNIFFILNWLHSLFFSL